MQHVYALKEQPSNSIMLTENDRQLLLRLSTQRWLSSESLEQMQQDIAALNELAFSAAGEPMLFKTSLLDKDFRALVAAAQSLERIKMEIIQSLQRFVALR